MTITKKDLEEALDRLEVLFSDIGPIDEQLAHLEGVAQGLYDLQFALKKQGPEVITQLTTIASRLGDIAARLDRPK